MPTHLKRKSPVAKKAHICNFCGCTITTGTAYWRDTLLYDGVVYDWISHKECADVSNKLNMYEDCDDNGLGPDEFTEYIYSYLHDYFEDEKIDDLPADVVSLDLYGKVKLILDTWGRPDIVLRRKMNALEDIKRCVSWARNKGRFVEKMASLEKEIAELKREFNL